jgi:hypothetical protein
MDVGDVSYDFERSSKDYPSLVWMKLVSWFLVWSENTFLSMSLICTFTAQNPPSILKNFLESETLSLIIILCPLFYLAFTFVLCNRIR